MPSDPSRLPDARTSSRSLLLTCAQMARVDAAAVAAGLSIDTLMAAAGHAIAEEAGRMLDAAAGHAGGVLVLCGPGNNGGDGYVAAAALARSGRTVRVVALAEPPPASAAARAVALWQGPRLSPEEALAGSALAPHGAGEPALIIDAMFGAGLTRPLAGAAAALARAVNASGVPVLAVDVPSGLDGDTGQPAGGPGMGLAVQATRTLTFFRRKPGHVLWPGRALCGSVAVAEIGLTEQHLAGMAPKLWVNTPELWQLLVPVPRADRHKYSRGACLVLSGPELQTGAARLAAWAALHAGAGAVTLAGDRAALRIHAAHVTAIMLRPLETAADWPALLADARVGAVVVGPGAGLDAATGQRLEQALASPCPLVLDADALTLLANGAARLLPRQPSGRGRAATVLTPHAGEFARLFGPWLPRDADFAALLEAARASRLEQARAAARLAGAIVVLKGPDTVIAEPGGRAAITTNAGPELATAGSGDVLAGLIAAHLAEGMPAFEAAAAAVWLHGQTGSRLGVGLTADRLAAAVRPLIVEVAG
jgi:NAD(P)H-hydrate epimerase